MRWGNGVFVCLRAMNKSVKTVKNSLKFKALPKSGMLSVKVGVRKHTVPIEVRMLAEEPYVFLSFSACSELFLIGEDGLSAMPHDADASEAYEALNPSKSPPRKRVRTASELPTEVKEALKVIPDGFKIGYKSDGTARLVRKRNHRSA